MLPIKLDYANLAPDVTDEMVLNWQDIVDLSDKKVAHGGGAGSDFLGWVDPAAMMPDDQLAEIQRMADTISQPERRAGGDRHRWFLFRIKSGD